MQEKRLLFIYNRKSGRGRISINLAGVIDVFSKAGYEIVIYPTAGPGDARERVLAYNGRIDAVACAGGDGTVNDVITGIIESGSELPLIYLPSGSTNDFAASLKLPMTQVAAARAAVGGVFKKLDIGRFNDKYFSYVAAFGFLTDISYSTDQNLKNVLGYAAYVLEVSKRLFSIPAIKMTVKTDNGTYSGDFFFGMVTNSRQVGGIKNITGPDIVMDDGIFEVTLIKATKNPVEFAEVLNALATGTHSYFIVRDKSARAEFHSAKPVAWTLCGEDGGTHTDVAIQSMKQAVSIAVPKETA